MKNVPIIALLLATAIIPAYGTPTSPQTALSGGGGPTGEFAPSFIMPVDAEISGYLNLCPDPSSGENDKAEGEIKYRLGSGSVVTLEGPKTLVSGQSSYTTPHPNPKVDLYEDEIVKIIVNTEDVAGGSVSNATFAFGLVEW